MVKPFGPVCNLECAYCYYLEKKKLYPGITDFRMTDGLLELCIRQYIESQDAPEVFFTWQGGEPALLGTGFFQKVIRFQQKYCKGKAIINAFQTNGTLLDEDWCKFFYDYNFLVGISIDGPEEIHNKYRLNISGKGSFERVRASLDLLNKYHVEFNTLTAVHCYNSKYPLEVYNFLKSAGSKYIQFIPVVERMQTNGSKNELKLVSPEFNSKAKVTEWTVDPEEYGNFLITIFDEWVRNDVGRIFVQLFDVTLANWTGRPPGLCVFSETCGNAVVMEFNGDVYSCDHFVYPEQLLGNMLQKPLKEIYRNSHQYAFGQNKLLNLPAYCIPCEYRFACHGECPKHRFNTAPDGEYGLNYLCTTYKMFFSYVHPYMQYMGDELNAKRPPANVMPWAGKYKRYPVIGNQ